jgi:hypothetical protein
VPRRNRVIALLLTAPLGLLVAAAPAPGAVSTSGGFTYVTKKFTPEPNVAKTLKAPCPEGTHAWGGGHYNDGVFAEALPRHSYPYDSRDRGVAPDDGWKTHVSAIEGVRVFVYAVCADPRPRYEQVSVTATPQARTSSQVGCDQEFEAVSGGTSGHKDVIETATGPGLGFDWFFAVDNYTQVSKTVKAFAVCIKREMFVVSSNDTVFPRTQEGHSASCAGSRRIVGGGVGNIGQFQHIAIAASRPTGFGSSAEDGWQVYLDNFDSSASYAFSVFATCVEPLR